MYEIAGKQFNSADEAEDFYLDIACRVMEEAIKKTPILTGRLVDQFHIIKFGNEPNQWLVTNTCEYAVFVHELVFNRHDNGQAKFLEDAAWEVCSQSNVRASMEIFPVKPGQEEAQAVTCYFDYGSKGYDIQKRRQDAMVLFARYYKWRCEFREARVNKIISDLSRHEAFKQLGIKDMHDFLDHNKRDLLAVNLKNIDGVSDSVYLDIMTAYDRAVSVVKRYEYENSRFEPLMSGFKQWSEQAGGRTSVIYMNERFVVPLSKIFGPTPYSDTVEKFSKQYETLWSSGASLITQLNQAVENIKPLVEQAEQDNRARDEVVSGIVAGDEDVIGNIKTDYLKRDSLDKNIDEIIKTRGSYDLDYFDLDTNRFINGFAKRPTSGHLKIKTVHSGKKNTLNRWEGVE